MFRKAAIVLAITLVFGSLSAARAEDPDEDFIDHFHAAMRHGDTWTRHHVAPFSEPQRPSYLN